MNKTVDDVIKEADKKIPRDAVSTRSGGGNKQFSYLEAHYVINRLNEVFGTMGWDSETISNECLNTDPISYRAKVRITAMVATGDGGYMRVIKEGYGYGSDKGKLNPHELAFKEAESDAFKRAARNFGMSFGLALYSKEQENVEDAPQVAQEPEAPKEVKLNRNTINASITTNAKVCIAKGYLTEESFKQRRKEKFGVDNTAALSDIQAQQLLTELKELASNGTR